MKIFYKMAFLTFSKVEINFAEKELTWKTYTAAKALLIIKKVPIINSKEFTKAVLNLE